MFSLDDKSQSSSSCLFCCYRRYRIDIEKYITSPISLSCGLVFPCTGPFNIPHRSLYGSSTVVISRLWYPDSYKEVVLSSFSAEDFALKTHTPCDLFKKKHAFYFCYEGDSTVQWTDCNGLESNYKWEFSLKSLCLYKRLSFIHSIVHVSMKSSVLHTIGDLKLKSPPYDILHKKKNALHSPFHGGRGWPPAIDDEI